MLTETKASPGQNLPHLFAGQAVSSSEGSSRLSATPKLVLWGFYACLMTAPFFGFSLLNATGRGILRIDWIAAVFFVGVAFASFLLGRLAIRRSPVNLPVWLFAYSAVFSIFGLLTQTVGIDQLIDFSTKAAQLFLALPFFFAISSLKLSEMGLKRTLRLWVTMAVVVSIFALYQVFAIPFHLPFAQLTYNNLSVTYQGGQARTIEGFGQVSSFFREPSYLGAYLLPTVILMIVFSLKSQGNLAFFRSRILNWGILAIIGAALLLTNSQAAYLSLAAAILAMLLVPQVGRFRLIRFLFIMAGLALLGGFALSLFGIDFFSAILLRFKYLIINMLHPSQTLEVTSFRVRTECMIAAFQVWTRSPLIGVGLNNMSHLTNVCEFSLGWSQLLVDQGLLGFTLMLVIFAVLIRNLYKLAVHPGLQPFWSTLCLAMIFILVGEMVDGFFTYNWVDLQRWINLGIANLVLILAKSHLADEQTESLQTGPDFTERPGLEKRLP